MERIMWTVAHSDVSAHSAQRRRCKSKIIIFIFFISTAHYSVHFYSSPSYIYDPFYHPIYSPFTYGYGYGLNSHVYHHHYYNNNNNNNNQNAGVGNNNNNNNNQNAQYNQTDAYSRQPMVLSYEPINKNKDDPDADSSEIQFANPYLVVGVENLLWYGEILDSWDQTVIIDQESDGERPRTFEEMYPMLANLPTTTVAPLNESTSSPQQLFNETKAAIFATLFSSSNSSTVAPLDTTTRTPLAPIAEGRLGTSSRTPLAPIPEETTETSSRTPLPTILKEQLDTSSRTPLATIPEEPSISTLFPSQAKLNADEAEKLYQLLHIFSVMQNPNETTKSGDQRLPPQMSLDSLLAELGKSNQQTDS